MDATVVCIYQTKNSMQEEPRCARKPHGTRPTIELTGRHDWICLLGAMTVNGARLFSRFEECISVDPEKHFILALCYEFEVDLIVVLDGPSYFQALAITDLAARDDLASLHYRRTLQNSIRSRSAGDNSKALLATRPFSSTYLTN